MAMLGDLDGAAGEPVAETPPVTLSAFIDSLQLTDDPEDVALMMEACQVNRIRVSSISNVVQWFFWQNVRALAEMPRHDFMWPEGFPGGALKQAQEQLEVAEERAESKAAKAKQSATFLMYCL